MKKFKRVSSLFLALAVVFGLLPVTRLIADAAPSIGDSMLHAVYTDEAVTVDGELSEPGYRRNIFLSNTLKVSALWDWGNIYLAFTDTAAPAVSELKVNGMAVAETGTASATTREIRIPLSSVGISKPDLTAGYALSFEIGEVSWSGKLIFDTVRYGTASLGGSATWGAVKSADGWTVELDTLYQNGTEETAQQHRDIYYPSGIAALAATAEAPTVVEFDLKLDHMPEVITIPDAETDGTRDALNGGINITVLDDETSNKTSGKLAEALLTGIYQKEGKVYLQYWDNDHAEKYVSVSLGDYVAGASYHLRIVYTYAAATSPSTADNDTHNDNVSAEYFVNGKLVATASSAKRLEGMYTSTSGKYIHVLTLSKGESEPVVTHDTRVDATIANLSVQKPQAVETPAGIGDNIVFATYSPDSVNLDGKLDEPVWRKDIPLTANETFSAIWDWHNLYVSVYNSKGSNVNSMTQMSVNGKAVHTAGTTGTGVREYQIPLEDVGIDEINFTKSYPISFELDGKTWEGKLVFDTSNYARIQNNKVYYSAVASADKYSVTLDTSATGHSSHRSLCNFKSASLNSSVNAATIVELDVQVDKMPDNGVIVTDSSDNPKKDRQFLKGGFCMAIRDEDATLSGSHGAEAMLVGLYKVDGVMQLIYYAGGAYKSVALETAPGNKYHLRMEYSYAADGSIYAKYFVNGKAVAEAADAKCTDGSFSTADKNIIQLLTRAESADADDVVKVVVSSLSVSKPQELEKPTDLEALTPEAVFGRIDLTNVQTDLPLNAEFTGESGTVYPLTWVIGDTSIIAADGSVTRHATEAKTTTVTLKADGMELWTVEVTVAPLTAVEQESPAKVDAAFSASSIVIDGSISEEGWRMGGRVLDTNKQLFAEYGFQWNQSNLFVAVDFVEEAQALSLTINGKVFTVENGKLMLAGAEVTAAQIAIAGGTVEIAIPVSVLGLGEKISNYIDPVSLTVKAGEFTGAGKTLNLSGIDWFVTDNREHAAPVGGSKSTDAQHGVTQLENGWRLYDLYDVNGTNKTGVRSYVLYQKLPVYIENFADRVAAKRVEFDFLATAMPVLDEAAFVKSGSYSNSGFTISMGDRANSDKDSWTTVWGIMNTEQGLQIVVQTSVGNAMHPLYKQVGDKFNIAVEWYQDDHMEVYVDGEKLHTIYDVSKYTNSVGDCSVVVNMRRNSAAPTCAEESFDVYMTNLAFGKVYDAENILNQLTFDSIKGSNSDQDYVVSDLQLVEKLTNNQLDTEHPITWSSSNPAVVDPQTGKVTQLADRVAIVTLTASLSNGEIKRFELIVPGLSFTNDGVLHVLGDTNPATGAGQIYAEQLFTFDTDNNSIIRDLGSKQKVNFAVLVDGDDKARLNAESLTLWVSDDNVTYTQVESFKLLHQGTEWFLYDFEAEGRYVKVHYTHYHGVDANFIGSYGRMIQAGYEEVFGYGEATATTGTYVLKNETGKLLYDYAWTISKQELGITGSDASIRIYLGDELLYHCVDGNNVIVRIPEVAAGATVTLTVKQSTSTETMDVANKEGVYEVTYGTRETVYGEKWRWTLTLPAGTEFPDGSSLAKETIYLMGSGNTPTVKTSVDGGLTWTETAVGNNAPAGKEPVGKMHDGSFFFDPHTGRIMYQSYIVHTTFSATNMNVSHGEAFIIASDDGGKTWYHLYTLPCSCKEEYKGKNIPRYALSYTEATLLSTYDGDGEGIDFVLPIGVQFDNTGCFATRVAYTKDAGDTWQYSESVISHPSVGSQGGCSEGWIVEREDGVLVLHTRCESADAYGFKVSYSVDHGLTWTNEREFSNYYATNTQAMLKKLNINGEEVITAIWGGNNALGGTSYIRSPLNFAVSTNGGDTFRHIQNIFSKTHMECYDTRGDHYVTNHSVTEYGDDQMLVTFRNLRGDKDYIRLYLTDFDKWYTRTKGAYDNFEHGTVLYEGWSGVRGIMELSDVNARGKYSMKLDEEASATRSIPYLQNGKISVDVFVAEDSVFTLALQNAYTNIYGVAMPMGLRVEGLQLYLNEQTTAVAELEEGWNTLTFDLNLLQEQATVTVNDGAAIEMPMMEDAGNYVCYITFGADTPIYVDELLVISDLEPVLVATDADEEAADEVIQLIKAIDTAEDKYDAYKAASEAFAALTQVQKDLVDGKTLVGDTLVNYYDVLLSKEAEIVEDAVEDLIEQIADIGTVTLESKAAIEAARADYNRLTEEHKALITNYRTLIVAENTLKALENEEDPIPPTGDTVALKLVVATVLVSLLAVALVLSDTRRKCNRK